MISKPIFSGPEIDDLCSKISWMRGVGWSDEKNISDLGQKFVPFRVRSVFLAQSHQISRAELENKKQSHNLQVVRPFRGGLCVRTDLSTCRSLKNVFEHLPNGFEHLPELNIYF